MIEDLILLVCTFFPKYILEKFEEYQWISYDFSADRIIERLRKLDLYSSMITEIENIPDGIHTLNLNHNKITEIENLPESLTKIILYGNPLIESTISTISKKNLYICL